MFLLSFFHHYFLWHYTTAFTELFGVWKNLLSFVVQLFSLPQLARSWFAPWKRMTEQRTRAWNFEDWAGTLLINILSRIVGAILRTIIIFIGLMSLAGTFIGGLITYLFWIVAPVAIISLLIIGCILIIS